MVIFIHSRAADGDGGLWILRREFESLPGYESWNAGGSAISMRTHGFA